MPSALPLVDQSKYTTCSYKINGTPSRIAHPDQVVFKPLRHPSPGSPLNHDACHKSANRQLIEMIPTLCLKPVINQPLRPSPTDCFAAQSRAAECSGKVVRAGSIFLNFCCVNQILHVLSRNPARLRVGFLIFDRLVFSSKQNSFKTFIFLSHTLLSTEILRKILRFGLPIIRYIVLNTTI